MRRATWPDFEPGSGVYITIHALREEGDEVDVVASDVLGITIHALREEGDDDPVIIEDLFNLLQSTPSVRRATGASEEEAQRLNITIHALREEGDEVDVVASDVLGITIHALREEGDL